MVTEAWKRKEDGREEEQLEEASRSLTTQVDDQEWKLRVVAENNNH